MPSISYSVIKPASIRPLVAAGGGQAFRQQAGERRRRASSLQLASPPVATRNGLACLLAECAILTHKFCHRAAISNRRFSYMFAPPSTKAGNPKTSAAGLAYLLGDNGARLKKEINLSRFGGV